MTNYEKYKTEIEAIWESKSVIALANGKPIRCQNTSCGKCDMGNTSCMLHIQKWLISKYEEPKVDWNKVKVDTPILVSDDGKDWHHRHFAKYENGKVWAWSNGTTSWSSEADPIPWHHAKLAEREE